MRMYLISNNNDTLIGMRLAGIKGTVVKNRKDAEELMEELLRIKDIGIILITENLAANMKERIDTFKQHQSYPLIVEIPDRHGSTKGTDYITGYIRDSIGIKI